MTRSESLRDQCFYQDSAINTVPHQRTAPPPTPRRCSGKKNKTLLRPNRLHADPHVASPWPRLQRKPEYKWLGTQFAASRGRRVGGRKVTDRHADENVMRMRFVAGFFFTPPPKKKPCSRGCECAKCWNHSSSLRRSITGVFNSNLLKEPKNLKLALKQQQQNHICKHHPYC